MRVDLGHDDERICSALEKSGLVARLSREKIVHVEQIAKLQEFKKNRYILKEDSASRDLYVLCDGEISIRVLLPTTLFKEEVIVKRYENEIFGEFSFVDGQHRTASVMADTSAVVLKLDYEKLTDLMEKDIEIGFRIMQSLSSLITSHFREITDAMQKLRKEQG